MGLTPDTQHWSMHNSQQEASVANDLSGGHPYER